MTKKKDNKKKKADKKKKGSKNPNDASNPNDGNNLNGTLTPDGSSNSDVSPTPFIPNIANNSNKCDRLKNAIDYIDKKILGRILSVLTLIALIIGFLPRQGTFVATISGKELESSNNDHNYLVFFDKESANLMKFKEFPRIFNPSRYALNDINLKYMIYADSLTRISYRSDYHAEDSPDDEGVAYKEVTYNKDKIKQGDTIPLPFRSFRMKDNAEARIELTATYSGYKTPFNYCANIYTKRINPWDESNLWESVYNEALSFLESKNDIDKFDLRYIDKEILPEHNSLTANWLREKVASYNHSLGDSTEKVVDSSWYEYDGTIYPTQEEIVMSAHGYYDSLGNYYGETYLGENEYLITYSDTLGNHYAVIITGDILKDQTLEEIVKSEFFPKDDKPDDKSTPWYMYIVAILLDIVFIIVISWLIRRILHCNNNRNTLLFVLEIIVTGFLSYIALMFSLRILFVTFQETSFLWTPLAFLYAMLFGLFIITSLFEKDDKDRNRPSKPSKDNVNHSMPDFNTTAQHNCKREEEREESIDYPSQVVVTIIWAVLTVAVFIIISRFF